MKTKIVFLILPLLFLATSLSAQDVSPSKKNEYCILKIYGAGYMGSFRGALIIYPDLTFERFELKEVKQEDVLKTTMTYINYISNKGYALINTSLSTANSAELYEYVFKKE